MIGIGIGVTSGAARPAPADDAPAAWAPSDVAGLVLQLEGDKGVTYSAGASAAWADQSGTGNNFSDGAGVPDYAGNVWGATDSNDSLQGGDVVGAATTAHTIAMLVKADADDTSWIGDSDNRSLATRFLTGAPFFQCFTGGTANYGFVTIGDTGWHRVVVRYDGSQSTNAARLRIWVDGVEQTGGSITHNGTIAAALTADTTTTVLNNKFGGDSLNGGLALRCDWQAALDAAVIEGDLDDWLAAAASRLELT